MLGSARLCSALLCYLVARLNLELGQQSAIDQSGATRTTVVDLGRLGPAETHTQRLEEARSFLFPLGRSRAAILRASRFKSAQPQVSTN